ncbi:hypothetical protein GCM10010212_33800 [Paenarthrobacter nicotinovorans]|nr:hypothetical protein GCM10010212_33800 [Paenarthrobacter nicotinovorans]
MPRDTLDVKTYQGNLLHARDRLDYLRISFVGAAAEHRTESQGIKSASCKGRAQSRNTHTHDQQDGPEPNLYPKKFHDDSIPKSFDAEMPFRACGVIQMDHPVKSFRTLYASGSRPIIAHPNDHS